LETNTAPCPDISTGTGPWWWRTWQEKEEEEEEGHRYPQESILRVLRSAKDL
jgi:hypothetical protein